MRKGSTLLGSLGAVYTGIALLMLPLAALAPGWASDPESADPQIREESIQAVKDALERRKQAEALSRRSARPAAKPSKTAASKVSNLKATRVIHTRATWYGPGFHGRRTASGERFNRYAMTLASRHLPFGTRVRVVNLRTGRAAVARVNDRGPFGKRGYTADLSQGLARSIGLRGHGPIRLEILGRTSRKPARED